MATNFEQSSDGNFQFLIIEPGDFVIKSLYDVGLVWQELVIQAQENPGMIPIVHIEDLRSA